MMKNEQQLEEQSWHQMYLVTEHWLSDVDFFKDELEFLRGLVDKHYMSFIEEHNLQRTRDLAALLSDTEKKNSQLHRDLQGHLKQLADLIEEPFSHDAQQKKDDHQKFEKRVADFAKEFRSVKKEAFALGKVVIGYEKGKHLLEP